MIGKFPEVSHFDQLFLRATSHTRLRDHDQYTSSTLIGGKDGAGPSSLHTTLEGPMEFCECKMDVKPTWIPTWHRIDHVSWSLGLFWIKNHFLGVGLTQNQETMALQTRWFIWFYHVWGPAWIEIHWNCMWLRVWSHITSHYTWRSVITRHDLEVCWDALWTLSFGLSQFHGHGSWLMCEVVLKLD